MLVRDAVFLGILKQIDHDLNAYTHHRQRDSNEEWEVFYRTVKRDGVF